MSNIRLVLADDEPVILRGLRMIVDWDALGVDIVGEAYDGEQLLELLDACEPDLILSDICMPNLSGIEVLKRIESSSRAAKVIFISAYREFEYAQDALKYGALDYLIKPVDMSQLEQVLRKAIATIRDASEEERKREKLQQLERSMRDQSIEEMLDRLTDGETKAENALSDMLNLGEGSKITVCVGDCSGDTGGGGRWQERERKLLDFAITNVMTETLKRFPDSYFFRKGSAFCFLVMHEDPDKPLQAAIAVRDAVRRYLKLDMTIGSGGAVDRIRNAGISCKQARETLERGYFLGAGSVIPYGGLGQDAAAPPETAALQEELLSDIVSSSLDREPDESLRRLLDAIEAAAAGSKHKAVSAICSALMALRQELKGMDISLDSLDEHYRMLLGRVSRFETYSEAKDFVRLLVADIHATVRAKLGNKETAQITQVKAYIDEHYADNITLETISAHIYMNPSYFSAFFKKHTGSNFKSYLTEVRMKHARRLLLHSDLMVYEVAEKVGYQNARLFSEVFKKMFGQIPQEYKQKKGKQADAGE